MENFSIVDRSLEFFLEFWFKDFMEVEDFLI